jgi:hypothetical protein
MNTEFWWGEHVEKSNRREEDDIKMVISEADFELRRRRTEDQSHVQWMTLTSRGQLTVAIPLPVND